MRSKEDQRRAERGTEKKNGFLKYTVDFLPWKDSRQNPQIK